MPESRIQAIEHLHMESRMGREEQTIRFYTELGGLEHIPDAPRGSLCFRSAHLRLCLQVVEQPSVDSVARRLTLRVPSLAESVRLLAEWKLPHERLAGLVWTDSRLVVQDPSGHRVELRQEWPPV